MALNPVDQVFNRWLLDCDFRAQMNENPAEALAGYDLTDAHRQKLSRLSRKVRRQAKAGQPAIKAVSPKNRPVAPFTRPPSSRISSFSLN